jgi:hypothetical protein
LVDDLKGIFVVCSGSGKLAGQQDDLKRIDDPESIAGIHSGSGELGGRCGDQARIAGVCGGSSKCSSLGCSSMAGHSLSSKLGRGRGNPQRIVSNWSGSSELAGQSRSSGLVR